MSPSPLCSLATPLPALAPPRIAGSSSQDAAASVYAAALVRLGWKKLPFRLKDKSDDDVSKMSAEEVARLLSAQQASAGKSLVSCFAAREQPESRQQQRVWAA